MQPRRIWHQIAGDFRLREASNQSPQLAGGIYKVLEDGMTKECYLRRVQDRFEFPYKVYGLETGFVSRVVRSYARTTGNLGIVMNGYKGTGKTVTAQQICNALNLPVILVNDKFDLLPRLINELPQPAVAAFNIGARWPDGRRDYDYVPAADAFCLLDLFDILAADKEAVFLPYHESFEYKRRSRKTKAKEGYPKFEADKSAECSIGDFTWHSSRLNLSLLARIPGVVDLGEESEKYNFAQNYKTHIWRNYTLIGDGVPNVSKLPVKLSEATYQFLAGKVDLGAAEDIWREGIVYDLDLTSIPVINQKIASAYLDTDTLCRKIFEEQETKAALKVYKYYLDALKQAKVEKGSLLTTAQEEFLRSKGITANGFTPPTEAEEATDVLVVKELSIAIKGLKALPKVADVEAAMEKGKKMTLAQKLMAASIADWIKESEGLDDFSKTHWLEREIERLKIELGYVRSYIQRAKFAVVLAKKSFDRVPKLAEATTVEWNDLSFDFSLREVEVKI